MEKKTKKQLLIFSLSIAVTLSIFGCLPNKKVDANDSDQVQKNIPKAIAFLVEAEYPARKDISKYFETTTRISAETKVDVVSKGFGLCEEIYVEEGDLVKAGQVLAKLDDSEVRTQILQTKVNIEKSKAALEIAENSLREGIGSKVERDNAQFALDAAIATLKMQELQLKNQTITAPISGIITRRNIQKGSMVNTGMPVFSIVDPNSYILPINIPEKEISKISIGQEAEVIIDSCPERKLTAKIFRINPTVDPSTGTVRTSLQFTNTKENDDCVKDSAFARVRLIMETRLNALVIPKDAVIEESGKKYVFIAEKKEKTTEETVHSPNEPHTNEQYIAQKVEIETGLEDSIHMEILKGVDEHSLVITLGQMNLKPGSIVEITSLEKTLASSEKKS